MDLTALARKCQTQRARKMALRGYVQTAVNGGKKPLRVVKKVGIVDEF
jgi:hypothetical protein